MRAVGIKNLKKKLSEYIRMASEGETVLVTDRDRLRRMSEAARTLARPDAAERGYGLVVDRLVVDVHQSGRDALGQLQSGVHVAGQDADAFVRHVTRPALNYVGRCA